MKVRDMQFLAALRQAQNFLVANDASLGGVNATGARKTLDEMIDKLAALAEAQDSHRIQVTGERTNELALTAELRRKHIRPIYEIARAKLPEVAKLSNVKLPLANGNSTAIAARAKAMGDAVKGYAETFIAAGLPVDFLAQLDAAATAVEKAVVGKGEHRSRRRGATVGIGDEVRAARKAVRVLDALVKANLNLKQPLVSEWRNAVQVVRGGRPGTLGQPATPGATPPTTAPGNAPANAPATASAPAPTEVNKAA